MSSNLINIKSKRLFLLQIIFATSFISLTSGVFLTGIAIHIGANDTIISYISVIPNICGIFTIVFVPLLERSNKKKYKAMILTIASKLLAVLLVFTSLIESIHLRLITFVVVGILSFALQSLSTLVINNWMINYINNDKEKGRYLSFRQKIIVICTLIVSYSAGKIMDLNGNKYLNFLIIYSIAFLFAIIEVIIISRISDDFSETKEKYKFKISIFLNHLLKNRMFLYYIFYVTLFYLALYTSDSFTMLYMMKYLRFSYVEIVFVQMLMTLPQIGLLSICGKIVDKYGSQRILYFSIWFFAGETLFLALSNPNNALVCVSLAFLIASVANSGFAVSVFSRRYEIIPKEGRMVYDSLYGAFIGAAAILGPLLGSWLKTTFLNNILLKDIIIFADIRFLYIISTIWILLLQIIFVFTPYFNLKKLPRESSEELSSKIS